jgi:hypothetical protein
MTQVEFHNNSILPPLPPLPVTQELHLEEPYTLGDDGRSFSSHNMMVRNSSIVSPMVTTTSDATQISGITGSIASQNSSQVARESLMLRTYTNKETSHVLSNYDKANIAEAAKKYLVGRLKFILPDRKFPSFWQPDLLRDTPRYVDAFFDSYGTKYKDRNTNNSTLVEAIELWKAAAPRMKKIVDNHRSSVAQKMKLDIMAGKNVPSIFMYCRNMSFSLYPVLT